MLAAVFGFLRGTGTSIGGRTRSPPMNSLRRVCGTPKSDASSTCAFKLYPQRSIRFIISANSDHDRIRGTFSRTIQRGIIALINGRTNQPDLRLSSFDGLAP